MGTCGPVQAPASTYRLAQCTQVRKNSWKVPRVKESAKPTVRGHEHIFNKNKFLSLSRSPSLHPGAPEPISPRWAAGMLGLAGLAASTQVLTRGRSAALKSAVGLERAPQGRGFQSASVWWGHAREHEVGQGRQAAHRAGRKASPSGGRRTLLPQPRGRGPAGQCAPGLPVLREAWQQDPRLLGVCLPRSGAPTQTDVEASRLWAWESLGWAPAC